VLLDELRDALGDAGLVLSLIISIGAAGALLRGCLRWLRKRLAERAERWKVVATIPSILTRMETEILELTKRFDLMMAQSEMASATATRGGEWTGISRAMQRQTARAAEELYGRGWYDAIDEFDRGEVIRRYEEAVRDLREFEQVFSWIRPDGEHVLVRMAAWFVKPIDSYVVNCRRLDPQQYEAEQKRAAATRRNRRSTDPEND
jgi:PAS domain S-box-containing protein